ncbi:hypothetical protein ABT282_08865 [Streptomyces sp. NPDC000927]|uniref:hypothetical protein n=1 Tax=Streptomyces sp. NPDC000927 TaxID=3154371 RepID=UPI003325DF1A
MMQTKVYSGLIEKVERARVRAGVMSVRFWMNMTEPPVFLAFEDGTTGWDLIKKGAFVEVEAEPPSSGYPNAIARRVTIADREMVCDRTLAQQAMEDAGQSGLF